MGIKEPWASHTLYQNPLENVSKLRLLDPIPECLIPGLGWGLAAIQLLSPVPVFAMGWRLGVCKFPGDADASGLGTTFFRTTICKQGKWWAGVRERIWKDWSHEFWVKCTVELNALDFLGGTVVKTNAGNARDTDLIPGSGRSPGVGSGNPLQYSCL